MMMSSWRAISFSVISSSSSWWARTRRMISARARSVRVLRAVMTFLLVLFEYDHPALTVTPAKPAAVLDDLWRVAVPLLVKGRVLRCDHPADGTRKDFLVQGGFFC